MSEPSMERRLADLCRAEGQHDEAEFFEDIIAQDEGHVVGKMLVAGLSRARRDPEWGRQFAAAWNDSLREAREESERALAALRAQLERLTGEPIVPADDKGRT
jgi:hypothetical protein